jgi:hypothetical protein
MKPINKLGRRKSVKWVIGMKVPARGEIFGEGGISSMTQAMGYVLTLPVSTIIEGISTLEGRIQCCVSLGAHKEVYPGEG